MQKFIVTGGSPLHGDVRIAGAKNAVLKLMAAAALTDEPVTLTNVPRISDVQIMREAMGDIGFEVACPSPTRWRSRPTTPTGRSCRSRRP